MDKFNFDIIKIILAQRGQDSIGYMVSSTLIFFRPYWLREGNTQLVYGKFYFDIIYIILAQRGQDSFGYMVSSSLISLRPYWPREGKTQLGIW